MHRRQSGVKYTENVRVVQMGDYKIFQFSFSHISVFKLFSTCMIFMSKNIKILRRKKLK